MLLAIDVGNSGTKLGLFRDEHLVRSWRLSTDVRRTADELTLQLGGLLALVGADLLVDVTGVVLSSVVPPATQAAREVAERVLGVPTVVVEQGVRTGIAIRHDRPQDLGADRIANAVAAQALFGGPAVVVDFGTAISFDAVDADGVFVGGAIAPGVTTATNALVDRAARLPDVEPVAPASPIGRSTVHALQSGIVHGFAGQVDRLVQRISDQLGPGVTTVATGTIAPAILAACGSVDHHDPALTLKGLRVIWARNQR